MTNGTTTLWAWAVPAFFGGSPVDHTWVTDYDNRLTPYPTITYVTQAGKNNWFCWGSFHPSGGTPQIADGLLGSIAANLTVATCLVTPNLPSNGNPPAQGTIWQYGIDGVCHQLANQVLWSSSQSVAGPLTVNQARGYHVSTFLFGTYGRQQSAWRNKMAHCASGALVALPATMTEDAMDSPAEDDEFARRARAVLSQSDDDRLQQILTLRGNAMRTADTMRARVDDAAQVSPSAAELNAHYNEVLRQAATFLSKDEYRALFGFDPAETVNLVDDGMTPPPLIS